MSTLNHSSGPPPTPPQSSIQPQYPHTTQHTTPKTFSNHRSTRSSHSHSDDGNAEVSDVRGTLPHSATPNGTGQPRVVLKLSGRANGFSNGLSDQKRESRRESVPGPSTRQGLSGSPAPSPSTFAEPSPAPSLPLPTTAGIPEPPHDEISRPVVEGDAITREAAAGFESRLRSTRNVDDGVRQGVSASGKGVRVGGTARAGVGGPSRKKGKTKADLDLPNQDFCSACRGIGRFLCCDGCPRSFHFMCLDPPLRIDELPEEETWYCKKCRTERVDKDSSRSDSPGKDKEPRPIFQVFKQLCKRVEEENPAQFRLPADVRQYFAGVGTGPHGAYVDAEETRTKVDRKGFQEERDSTRLRDGKRPVACYACGGSSIPLSSHTTDPESSWRQIVSCDYCLLHWHLDCLNPPLASMPPSGRKWMCPNHAEQVMPRRRTIKANLETIDVEGRHMPNNGNIVVISDEATRPPLEYEDMIINRKRYRVPERVIRLDFWDKLGKGARQAASKSSGKRKRTLSTSSLTSLSDTPSEGEMEAANLILGLKTASTDPLPVPSASVPVAIPTVPSQSGTPKIMLKFNARQAEMNGSGSGAS